MKYIIEIEAHNFTERNSVLYYSIFLYFKQYLVLIIGFKNIEVNAQENQLDFNNRFLLAQIIQYMYYVYMYV
jgi:hypothetical protein